MQIINYTYEIREKKEKGLPWGEVPSFPSLRLWNPLHPILGML